MVENQAAVPIAYDVTRLFLGPFSSTPRGIDRVDFALAQHLFSDTRRTCVGVMPSAAGVRIFSGARVLRGLERLEYIWQEARETDSPAFDMLAARFAGKSWDGPSVTSRRCTPREKAARFLSLLGATGISLGRSPVRSIPRGAVYVNVGHYALAVPALLGWLRRRPDIASVFMLHDVIPLEAPGLVAPDSARHHATMVASTARYADGLIVSTRAARRQVNEALALHGRGAVPTLAHPLPLARVFDAGAAGDPRLAGTPYYVVCGAIEPRKNHALLAKVWTRLRAALGAKTPHLLVLGSPGWQAESIRATLEDASGTDRRIHVISGLSTPTVKRLIAGAAGLLMPSLAEGFGLPLIEARHLGRPVIASAIPAHAEVCVDGATLLDPQDDATWAAVLERWTREGPPALEALDAEVAAERRRAYFTAIENFLTACAARGATQERGRPTPRYSVAELARALADIGSAPDFGATQTESAQS